MMRVLRRAMRRISVVGVFVVVSLCVQASGAIPRAASISQRLRFISQPRRVEKI